MSRLVSFALCVAVGLAACGSDASSRVEPPPPEPTAAASDAADAPVEPAPPAPVAPPEPALTQGVDVSTYSGEVAWDQVRASGVDFAIAKATEGLTLADSAFERNWSGMKEAGLVRGAYHFFITSDEPEGQARFFMSRVELEPGDLAPVVDIEKIHSGTTPGLVDRFRRYLELLEAHYGVRPIIYTSPRFWNDNLDGSFGDYPLWIAEYGVDAPRLPAGWDDWHLWQWKADASLAGVENGADLNRVNESGADLSVLRVPAVAASPE